MKSFRQFAIEATKEPWQMTHKEYLGQQKTGNIPSHAYERYRTSEGLSWVKPANYPEVVATVDIHGQEVKIQRSREHIQYCKYGPDDEIMRDNRGMAIMMTDAEAQAKGYPVESANLAAFVGDRPVGMASNEFGSTGVWVVDEFQRGGLGTKMLQKFHQLNPRLAAKPMGQMTNAGVNLATAYHRMHIKQALEDGKPVPQQVLADYPELKQ